MNLREGFREIQAQFERESHHHPGLRHFWLQAVDYVHTRVLKGVAQTYDQPLAEVTEWRRENQSIDVSCFVGDWDKLEYFKRLACQARSLFVQLLEQLGKQPRHGRYDAPIAWLADLYYLANREPKPELRVKEFALGEWPTGEGTNRLLPLPFGEKFEARLQALKRNLGEPTAVHRVQGLVQDVFTASKALIIDILEDRLADLGVGTALNAPACELPALMSAGENSPPSESRQPAEAVTSAATATTVSSDPRDKQLDTSEPERGARPTAEGESSAAPSADEKDTVSDPSLDDEDVSILQALEKRDPLRLTQDQIAAKTSPRISRRTIANRMPRLVTAGLAALPHGKKQGYTITQQGRDLLAKLGKS
jgi:hypothetical protein